MTIGQGSLVGGTIVRGRGVELTWDAAGQRRSATTAANVSTAGQPGTTPSGAHRESYSYSDDGQLVSVTQANATDGVTFGAATLLASYTRDALGRVLGDTSNATTTYRYVWRDGALASSVTLTKKDGSTQSLYGYDEAGRLTGLTLTGGARRARWR